MSDSTQEADEKEVGYVEVPTSDQPFLQEKHDGTAEEGKAMRPISAAPPTAKEVMGQRLNIWKNVFVISMSFTSLFTAQGVVAVLQSSINSEAGVGVLSQATIHVATIFSSLFLPTLVINYLGLKWTMVASEMCYLVYVAVQFYPTFYTLIPAAILVGLGAAPLGSAQATYLTTAGSRLAGLLGMTNAEPFIARFFGFFGMSIQSCTIWGSLINSAVLSRGVNSNRTNVFSEERLSFCGANFCLTRNLSALVRNSSFFNRDDDNFDVLANATEVDLLEKPSQENLFILFGILGGFIVLAGGSIALFVDNPPKELAESAGGKLTGWQLVIATFRHAKNPYQLLIIPLTMFSGFSLAFLSAEFTAAYVVCAWGVEHIGYVLVCYGITSSLGSLIFGILVKLLGRLPIILFGSALSVALFATMLFFWHPDPSDHMSLFAVSGVYGFANAIWQTQLNSFYGVVFNDNKEPAFANLRLWQSLGFAFAFASTTVMCVSIKLYIIIVLLIIGTVGYVIIEIKERKKPANKK